MKKEENRNSVFQACFIIIIVSIILAGVNAKYFEGWLLESAAVMIFLPILYLIDKKLKLSNLSYIFITLFVILHAIGSHYTYTEVPLGAWLKSLFGFSRNHYDRIIHFAFGLLLYFPALEIYRKISSPKPSPKILSTFLIPFFIITSIGGLFEILEWVIVASFPEKFGIVYMGLQGDMWDAQKDMFFQTLGCLISTLIAYFKK